MNVGDTLSRKGRKRNDGRDSIRLVGIIGGTWAAQPADAFGATFTVDDATLISEYGVKDPSAPEFDHEARMREADAKATERAANLYFGRGRRPARPFEPIQIRPKASSERPRQRQRMTLPHLEAIGWLSAELATRADAWNGNAPEWFPEPPEWLELWARALEAEADAEPGRD